MSVIIYFLWFVVEYIEISYEFLRLRCAMSIFLTDLHYHIPIYVAIFEQVLHTFAFACVTYLDAILHVHHYNIEFQSKRLENDTVKYPELFMRQFSLYHVKLELQ